MCRIQKELFDVELREIRLHGEKGVQEGKHIMLGSAFQKRKNRKVINGIGSHIHVEVVAEKIAFSIRWSDNWFVITV